MANIEEMFRTRQPDYSGLCVREVTYATLDTYYGGQQDYKLDVITSETVPQNGYVVMFVHGGAFSQPCDKRQLYICLFARELCAQGYTVVSPDYPLFDDVSEFETHPENHMRAFQTSSDAVNAACRFIMAHAEEYGVKPGKAAIMGGSAGGMASVYAVSKAPEQYFALVPLWGSPTILPDVTGFPPTLCVHGTDDKAVPIALEKPFGEALDAANVPHELITLPGWGHTPIPQMPVYMPSILRLLAQTRP
ncbi:MAG: alpha/beta hydrolase [Aristaeellaceae bacterium]